MDKKRLIVHTDSRKQSDINTFRNAAITLSKSYKSKYPSQINSVKVIFVKNGKEIVSAINAVGRGNLVSLDIVSHGNQGGIHISRNLNPPVKAGFLKQNAHYQIRKNSDNPQTMKDAKYMEESMHGLYADKISRLGVSYYYNQTYDNSPFISTLDDINFDVFAVNAVVEFHGCRTAEIIPVLNTWLKDNFAARFSSKLGNKGTVIGHITNTAPDKNPNGNVNDYRYGKVRTYKNGELVKDGIERWKYKLPNSSTPQ
ncbi:MAG: hypothetical protein GY806_05710 [Gammaproteobacteria bacterium]|nr:hypothetical protein [Gammaproteobacteria bacterium]